MSLISKITRILLLMAVSTLVIGQAQATNGYFAHGYSVKDKAMAGAGVAYSNDTLAAATNPAGMVLQGESYDIGGVIFSPTRTYTSTGGPSAPVGTTCGTSCPFSIGNGNQSIDSDNEMFLIPHYGQNWMLDNESSIGLSVYGNGGMNTEWQGGVALLGPAGTTIQLPGTYGGGTAGVDLAQLFISTTYSRKISETASWGVSGIVAYQVFNAKGISNFAGFSLNPSKLSNNGDDSASGIGFKLGIQGKIAEGVTLGASIQPEIDMGEFDKYAGLFAENGDFDIPSTWTIGVAWQISGSRVFQIDVQQINYEDVAAVSNPITSLTPAGGGTCVPGPTGGTGAGCLGGANGAGFGWEDMTVIKLGYEWQNDSDWTWRVGYSTTDQPIPNTETTFNILAPGVMEDHLTFGFTRKLDSNSSVDFAFMFAPNVDVSGANTFDPAQTINLEMNQYEVALSYSKTF